MNGTQVHAVTHEPIPAHTHTRGTVAAGGAMLEGFGAVATMALAIVGLAGVLSTSMAAIATLVLGAAILFEGGAVTWKNGRIIPATMAEGKTFEIGAMADFQGGVAAIVLGILALLGISPLILLSVALIAVGAAFLFSGRFVSGLAGVVLGILAVVGLSSLSLVLVGLLVLGAGTLFAGSELAVSTWAEQR
jgi:hypothetical protein